MAKKKITTTKRALTPFGKEVKKRLIDIEMSQGLLEQEVGVPRNYVTQILHGICKESRYIEKIGEYLNIDTSKYT